MIDKSTKNKSPVRSENLQPEKEEGANDNADIKEDSSDETEDNGPKPHRAGYKRSFRRVLAMIALVAAVAVALTHWSRMDKATLTLEINPMHGGARIHKAEIFLVDSEGDERVRISLTEVHNIQESPKRKLRVEKGTYTLHTKVLHKDGTRKRKKRKLEIEEDTSLTLNLR
jgi:hypothetical protein